MFVKSTHNLAPACYKILKIIARHGKPLSDDYCIKDSWPECAPYCLKILQMITKVAVPILLILSTNCSCESLFSIQCNTLQYNIRVMKKNPADTAATELQNDE